MSGGGFFRSTSIVGAFTLISRVTGLLRDSGGRVVGVRTDRPDGDLRARVVIACDGVNSFVANAATEVTQSEQFQQLWVQANKVLQQEAAVGRPAPALAPVLARALAA